MLYEVITQRMNGFGTQDVPKMFNRLEDRVSDMEWEARSLRELRKTGQDFVGQANSTLDEELSRLKQKLQDKGEE